MNRRPTGPIVMAEPAAKGGGKFPFGKLLLGCGCLTLAIVGVIGLAVAGIMYAVGEKAAETFGDDYSVTEAVELFLEGSNRTESASATSASDEKATSSSKKSTSTQKKEADLSPEKVRAELEKPLTQNDLDRVFGVYEDLKKTDAYEEFHSSMENLKNLGKKGSEKGTIETMKMMRDGVKGAGAHRDLVIEYEKIVKKRGGVQKYMGSLIRMSAAAEAAKQIAKDHKKENTSDEVADLVLKDRPAIKKEFEKTVAEAKKMAKKGDGQNIDLAGVMMLQKPGTIAIARAPEKTFKKWKSLSPEKRKEIIMLPRTAGKDFAGGMLVGALWSGAPLLISAEAATMKEFAK